MRDPTTYRIRRADEGCFHYNTFHCNMLVPVEWVEQTARLVRLSWVLSPALQAGLKERWEQSLIASPQCFLSGEVKLAPSSLTEVDQGVWGAEWVLKPPERKRRHKVWAPYSCPGLLVREYFPVDRHPPTYKAGKRKNEAEVHRPPCSFVAGASCIPISQSRRVGFVCFSFSAQSQGEKLWLGGSTTEALPIRQVYQRNMT